ncbi:MAG: hypothetical protein HEP71_25760 [Roseivirga sp.]|nr:hypothetical protein [Roseivirga sp.]
MRECFGFLLCASLLFSCSSQSQEEKAMLKEAYELQLEVIEGVKDLKLLTALERERKDSLEHILHEIEESLFAIPGYELELPGHEGHDHDHSRISLSSKEMLDVQHELHKQVTHLKSTFQTND